MMESVEDIPRPASSTASRGSGSYGEYLGGRPRSPSASTPAGTSATWPSAPTSAATPPASPTSPPPREQLATMAPSSATPCAGGVRLLPMSAACSTGCPTAAACPAPGAPRGVLRHRRPPRRASAACSSPPQLQRGRTGTARGSRRSWPGWPAEPPHRPPVQLQPQQIASIGDHYRQVIALSEAANRTGARCARRSRPAASACSSAGGQHPDRRPALVRGAEATATSPAACRHPRPRGPGPARRRGRRQGRRPVRA